MDTLLLPFEFQFMTKAFCIMIIISIPTAMLSCYLVLKGWSLMGDAISHSVLPGVILAYLLNIPLIIGAFCAGMICAVATGFLSENSRVKRDTIMGVVFSGMFGIGIVIHTKITTDVHLDHILFGNMLGISNASLWTSGLISLFISMILIAKYKDILLHSFDPIQAQATGLPVNFIHYGLLAMISLIIVATLSAVGIILSIGLLIAPGAIAFLLTKKFEKMLIIAIIITILSGFLGIYLSFFIDSAPAPTIILILTIFFIIAFVRSAIATRQA
jgi:manganese/iron transport system permease protein|tara:strand:+ start:374 stop:1192 length:819 start_codon:yes stop_codon:yes gene_type:complete